MTRNQHLFSRIVIMLFLMVPLFIPGEAHCLDLAVIYSGKNTVDMSIGNCGTERKCELYRNGSLVKAWENRPETETWYSDAVSSPGVYRYYTITYRWSDNQWVLQSQSETKETDSRVHNGTLRNSSEWAGKYGRDTITWKPEDGTHYVQSLTVESGNFFLNNLNVVFEINQTDQGNCGVITIGGIGATTVFAADGTIFNKAEGATCTYGAVNIVGQQNPALTSFKNCTITNTAIYPANYSTGIKITGNTLTNAYIGASIPTSGHVVEGNTGTGYSISLAGGQHTVRQNTGVNNISVSDGSNVVEKNESAKITATGNGNTITGNAVTEMEIGGTGSQVSGNTARYILLSNNTNGHTVKNNSMDCTGYTGTGGISFSYGENHLIEENRVISCSNYGIDVYWGKNNTIKKNMVKGSKLYGIRLSSTSSNNIEFNEIRENGPSAAQGSGIFITNAYGTSVDYGSKSNVIAFNRIWGHKYGIYFDGTTAGNNLNGIHENIIENNTSFGVAIFGTNNNTNSIYNNVLRGNGTNARDNGAGNKWHHDKAAVNSNIVGGPWLAGNYWGDYTGVDIDPADGIGDTPYGIKNSSGTVVTNDELPLKPSSYGPAISADSTPVAFGEIDAGNISNSVSRNITSTGTSALTIWQIHIAGTDASQFKVQSDTCSGQTIPSPGTCAISVIFSPTSKGNKTATLIIPSSDPDMPSKEIALAGTGKEVILVAFTLPLSQGWNFISIPILPSNTSIDNIVKDISPSIRIIWGYDNQNKEWLKFKPSAISYQLSAIESSKGYWIYMDNAANLSITGVDASPAISLSPGWNLVGYSASNGQAVSTSLDDISGNWAIVWGWDSGQWSAKAAPDAGTVSAPELAAFNRGKAFWIKTNSATVWQQ